MTEEERRKRAKELTGNKVHCMICGNELSFYESRFYNVYTGDVMCIRSGHHLPDGPDQNSAQQWNYYTDG